MKIDFKNINKSKFYMIIGICILCISVLGSSIAYYRTVLFDDLTVDTITHGLDYYINYSKGQNISGATLELSSDYSSSAANTSITFYKKDNTYDIYGHIYLDVNEIGTYVSTSNALKYTLVNNNNVVAEGTLKGSSSGDSILVKFNIPLEVTEQVYTIYIWLDENEDIPSEAENETLSLTVRCEATMKPLAENLVTYINNLYMNNKDATPVTNNGIEYTYASIYDKDTDSNTSGGLMNDRLGDSEVGSDDGNIRYYGKNPLNYIDIGDVYAEDTIIDNFELNKVDLYWLDVYDRNSCYDYFDCTKNYENIGYEDVASCEAGLSNDLASKHVKTVDDICGTETKKAGDPILYRIIGLFKNIKKEDGSTEDLVKIIREDAIGNFAWDLTSDDSGYSYSDDWRTSTLKSILNTEYYNSRSINHTYHSYETEDYISVTTDLSKIGLNSSVHNKIETVIWNIDDYGSNNLYADGFYYWEREAGAPDDSYREFWSGNIGLMYPSDYGYAADFTQCDAVLGEYSNTGCHMIDWLAGSFSGNWTMTNSLSYNSNSAWVVSSAVYQDSVYVAQQVRPTMFLKSSLDITIGDGSKDNPYVVEEATSSGGDNNDHNNTFISHITNLYLNNKDATLVNNNGIDYRYASIYDKDDDATTSGGLMNDRQGSMDIGEDAGNIRYYGATPNNYIYFNCDDYNNPSDTTCELWRIIGIVDGKVKIARDSILSSTMAWNTAGNNNWSTASLNTYLNGDYYESLRTKNPYTLDLISMSTWYLGGYSTSKGLYANDIYEYERKNEVGTTIYSGNPPSIETNIGLMYASDYGYATDLSVCDKDIYNYDTSANCKDKDWLLKSNGTNTQQWLINPRSSFSSYAWPLNSNGCVNFGRNVTFADGVRAVLYLNSELVIETGDGSKDTPYVVR